MNWYKPCAYDAETKRMFHSAARTKLRLLAGRLGLDADSYDLRANQGGIAVSGEVTLHHEDVYIQVSQPATGADMGILIRRCEGRQDYTGGQNFFAKLSELDDLDALESRVRGIAFATDDTPIPDRGLNPGPAPRG